VTKTLQEKLRLLTVPWIYKSVLYIFYSVMLMADQLLADHIMYNYLSCTFPIDLGHSAMCL